MGEDATKKGITHNTYFDGAVQSLGFINAGGDMTVGVILPGEYDFGPAGRPETIHVKVGTLIINGSPVAAGEKAVVQKGDPVKVTAEEVAAYLCAYYD